MTDHNTADLRLNESAYRDLAYMLPGELPASIDLSYDDGARSVSLSIAEKAIRAFHDAVTLIRPAYVGESR